MSRMICSISLIAASVLAATPAFAADGVFSGQATGVWGTPVQVSVTVKNGKVADIAVKEQETPALGGVAIQRIRGQMLKSQTLDVDAVAGATISSFAFKTAVQQALAKAKVQMKGKKPAAVCRGNGTADVVVVGAGPSGMMAAIELKKLGQKVVLLEKQGIVGGNGSYVSTSFKAGGSKPQTEQNVPKSSIPEFEKYLAGHKGATAEMSKVVAEESPFVVNYLIDHGADLGKVSKTYSMGPKDGSSPGNQITPAFAKGLAEAKIDVRVDSPATELIKENGRVVGVRVAPRGCAPYVIRAKAVVLSTGGFSASKAMRKKYTPDLATLGTTNAPGTQGDGYAMAEKVGAKLVGMSGVSVNPTTYNTGHALLSFTPIRYQAIMVSKDGVRFVDGNIPDKNVVTAAMLKASGGTGHAYLIFDQEVYEGLGIAREYVKKGYILSAPTIPELGKKLGVNPQNLEKTITNFAKYAKEGVDPEFNQKRFECRFTKAPYYGVQVEPAVHASKGGIAINTNGQALDADGKPIPGLFALGQVTESQLGLHNTFVFGGPALSRHAARFIAQGAK